MADEGAQLLEELMRFRPEGMTANAWAVKAGVSRTIWSDLRRHGNPSRRTLSKLLEAAGSSLAEFEALRIGAPSQMPIEGRGALADPGRTWRPTAFAPLPLIRTVEHDIWAGPGQDVRLISIERDEVIDRLPRPASLAADQGAYALTVVGNSMWPRFRQGRQIAASPASPVDVGDDVLVILVDGQRALFGELQLLSAESIGLRQFNPAAEFEVPAAEVAAVHKVMGELI